MTKTSFNRIRSRRSCPPPVPRSRGAPRPSYPEYQHSMLEKITGSLGQQVKGWFKQQANQWWRERKTDVTKWFQQKHEKKHQPRRHHSSSTSSLSSLVPTRPPPRRDDDSLKNHDDPKEDYSYSSPPTTPPDNVLMRNSSRPIPIPIPAQPPPPVWEDAPMWSPSYFDWSPFWHTPPATPHSLQQHDEDAASSSMWTTTPRYLSEPGSHNSVISTCMMMDTGRFSDPYDHHTIISNPL